MTSLESALRSYLEFYNTKKSVDELLLRSRSFAELSALYSKIDSLVARQKVLLGSSRKIAPIDIGDSDPSQSAILDDTYSLHDATKRAQAKILARRLYSIYHPDKPTGDTTSFTLIRAMVSQGDLEGLLLFRMKEGVDKIEDSELKRLQKRFEIQLHKFKSMPSFQVTRLYITNRVSFIPEMKRLLEKRIEILETQLLGASTKSSIS